MLPQVKEALKMDDIDAMFSDLLGEIDDLSQSLTPEVDTESTLSIGFTDLNESLHELEDPDLDSLVSALQSNQNQNAESAAAVPHSLQNEPQTKEDKIKLAMEKMKEAKIRKLLVKVLMGDGCAKVLMVDERQTVRDILDVLLEKTHCDCSLDWSLCETNPELHTERVLEDHEHFVECLSTWTRFTENKIYFLLRPQKYVMFKDPHVFYVCKEKRSSEVNEQVKQLLIKENFGGSTVMVPDLEGTLYLKEDGKKIWKPRYFVLRASGMYYVPRGKTKSSSDLVCFVHFEKVNVYTTNMYDQKYKAPTDCCFVLKHPRLQKESDYVRFLCCEDQHTLLLWTNAIRIAKYGTSLYRNYQAAMTRTSTLKLTKESL